MKLKEFIEEATGLLKKKISYAEIGRALGCTRQCANQYRDKELKQEQLDVLQKYFKIDLTNDKKQGVSVVTDDCISIPVLGCVSASMGYGVTVYDEQQTATYSISRKLAKDLGIFANQTEMIFAQGDSMLPTIEGGDSLLVDHSRREIYDGKIYCVRIEGQLYAKRLQKIPPNTVRVVSDNSKYRSFEIDFSKEICFDFAVIGEVRWWGRVAR